MALIRRLFRRRRYRYCGGRCIRLAGHPGLHVDESGRSWP